MTEKQIQAAVVGHWRVLGLPDTLVAAIPNAGAFGQSGLTAGLPDLLVIGGPKLVAFIELKTETGRPTLAQKVFAALCRKLGIPHEFTYGRDEPIRVLERWEIVRPSNW